MGEQIGGQEREVWRRAPAGGVASARGGTVRGGMAKGGTMMARSGTARQRRQVAAWRDGGTVGRGGAAQRRAARRRAAQRQRGAAQRDDDGEGRHGSRWHDEGWHDDSEVRQVETTTSRGGTAGSIRQRVASSVDEGRDVQHDRGTEGRTRRRVELTKVGTMTTLGNTARGGTAGR